MRRKVFDLRKLINFFVKPRAVSRLKATLLRSSLLTKIFCLRYFSINCLDQKVEQYLNFNNGYFVELGANDGVNQSNTLYFERFRGWRGVLIEPYKPNYTELVRNRSSQNFFKNAACVGPTYSGPTISLWYSNLMTTTIGIDSDIQNPKDHADQGSKFWGGSAFMFEAPAFTLNNILLEAGSPRKIDLLSLDVEGVELEILNGIDHSIFRFKYVLVESRQFEALCEFLEQKHYSFEQILSNHDYLFKDNL